MPIVSLAMVKAQLNQTQNVDDELIERKIAAAQNHIENLLGFKIEERFPPTDDEPPVSTAPASFVECVCQLAAHWYENREATLVGVSAQSLPYGVNELIAELRDYSFGVMADA